MPRDDRPTVYSTDPDFKLCPRCQRYPCRCPQPRSLPPREQTASLHLEKKGRGGKTVTIIRGLQLSPEDLKSLGKTLKTACGTGGTLKDGDIEIQGDHRQKIAEKLRAMGYKTKFVGG
jgi:translation initiation factor 1